MAGKFNYEEYKKYARQAESSGNDRAVSAANAKGRYQFLPSTWSDLGMNPKDIFNPMKQEEAMKKFTEQNVAYFRKKFNRDPDNTDVYGMHHLGAAGYVKVLSDPTAPVSKYYSPKALSQNPHFKKYKTMGNLKNYFQLKMEGKTPTFKDDGNSYSSGGVDYRDYVVELEMTKEKVKDFTNIEGIKIKENSSHIKQINLPDVEKEVEAKKEILVNEMAEKMLNQQPQQQIQTPQQPQEQVQQAPTYEYLQNTNLFQI